MRLFPITTWNKTIRRVNNGRKSLLSQPWAQGVLLLICVVIAMLLANLPFTKEYYHEFLETSLSVNIGEWSFPKDMNVEKFINDILMVVFFFTVGLEIKREVVAGELSSVKKALMPVIAAFGGVVAPALIFTLVNHGTLASSGWGIPTATDIAFAVGILSILGDKVPVSLKVFLTALAIADDLIAILVVAIFYGGSINFLYLGLAALVIVFIYIMNKVGEKKMIWYIVPAVVLWFLFYYAGIHSTMAGVVMAFLVPMAPRYNKSHMQRSFKKHLKELDEFEGVEEEVEFPNALQRHSLRKIGETARCSMGMSYKLEHDLSEIVNFVIMPIFALANAGVVIEDVSLLNIFQYSPELGSVGMGIFFGLLLGKPVGIFLTSWIAIKCKVGAMPDKGTWSMLFAVACLGGIGFTMSIFVDTLSFGDTAPEVMEHLRSAGKIAVLLASLSAGVLGSVLISIVHKAQARKAA